MLRFASGLVTGFILLISLPVHTAVHQETKKNKPLQQSTVQTEDPFERIPNVKFLTKANEVTTYFTPNGLILAGFTKFEPARVAEAPQYFELKILLRNARPDVEITTLNPRLSKNDFFGGESPSWLTNIPNYAKVKYANCYPDVEMLFQVQQQQLDLHFVIAPGGDPRNIRFQVQGAQNLRLTPEGALLLDVHNVTFEIPKPEGYQAFDESSARSVVDARYILAGKNEISLLIAPYDSKRTLVIHR